MKSRLIKLWLLGKQYSVSELVSLAWLMARELFGIRSPSDLLRSKHSFYIYFDRGYAVKRVGQNTMIAYKDMQIAMRRNSSDFLVFDQIMDAGELDAVIEIINQENIDVRTVLDCGANIGLSSLYLSARLKNVNIVAIEPEPENFSQLYLNIKNNPSHQIHPMQLGAWSRKALLEHDVNFCNAKHWAFSVREPSTGPGTIAVDTLDNIADAAGMLSIDYLKMDIEGAEFEIFRNLQTWDRVFRSLKIISIEVHEKKGPVSEIQSILNTHGFQTKLSGELIIGWRK